MLTRLLVRNFKRFEEFDVSLDSPVLFIGPNNSGKTSALQALTLWDLGKSRWLARWGDRTAAKRPGVAIGRRDVVSVPIPDAKHLWRRLRVRHVFRESGRQRTANIRIDICVDGLVDGRDWKAGFEFDYANEESFYCRPLRTAEDGSSRMEVPPDAAGIRVAYLPPMSGMASNELRLEPGGVNVRVGEGRTAEVLRNLCFRVYQEKPAAWETIVETIAGMYGARVDPPRHIVDRGEIAMSYREDGVPLDLTASGRGMQQTLLLLSHLALNPGTIILMDEPDAHLEIVRQREIYDLLSETVSKTGGQLVIASHSEVLLRHGSGRARIVAFVGQPHDVEDDGQLVKSLRDIGYGEIELARKSGFVLYVEGISDLPILRALAVRVGHPDAVAALDAAFVRTCGNQPGRARDSFYGLREALPQLVGVALFDRLPTTELHEHGVLQELMWRRREIENYLCSRNTLMAFAEATAPSAPNSLFHDDAVRSRKRAISDLLDEMEVASRTLDRDFDPWSGDTKASDEVLKPLMRQFHERMGEPDPFRRKSDYARLAAHVPEEELISELGEKLDAIARAHSRATPNLTY